MWSLGVFRYILYALDLGFGAAAWGVTAPAGEEDCVLDRFGDASGVCYLVTGFGMATTFILLVILLLRTLDVMGKMTFHELIEFFLFVFMSIVWLVLAALITSETDLGGSGKSAREALAIAFAWLAWITHTCSAVISLVARRRRKAEEDTETQEE